MQTVRYVRSGKLLLALASTVILISEPRGTRNHILVSHNCEGRATPQLGVVQETVTLIQNAQKVS
jgi:hypothetical protein